MPKPIETFVEQGTDDWHKFRSLGFGASEANIIAGKSKWSTVTELWELKTGKFKPDPSNINAAMQHGIDTEPEARERFMLATGLKITPRCFEHHKNSFIRASLDGITDDLSTLVEIKCPKQLGIHMKAVRGTMPDYYYPQVQHQLYVTGAKLACYWSYAPSMGGFLIEVEPNKAYIAELVKREKRLWKHVVDDTPPKLADFPELDP